MLGQQVCMQQVVPHSLLLKLRTLHNHDPICCLPFPPPPSLPPSHPPPPRTCPCPQECATGCGRRACGAAWRPSSLLRCCGYLCSSCASPPRRLYVLLCHRVRGTPGGQGAAQGGEGRQGGQGVTGGGEGRGQGQPGAGVEGGGLEGCDRYAALPQGETGMGWESLRALQCVT
jgi:hypothetical protein